ncbi:GspE/PulE family protein, partial [Oleiphilus sp. HI0067]
LKLQFVDLNQQGMNLELSMQLPETMARRLRAIVLSDNGRTSLIGMADPMDLAAVDEIAKKLGHDVEVAVIRESQLLVAFDEVYKQNEEISTIATELDSELSAQVFDIAQLSQADVDDSDAPVVRLLQTIFEDAVLARASDVHIEPEETVIRIRRRVDGVLSETVMRETRVGAALVLRLKLMCGLNISEKRLPQDGRFNILVNGRSIDVRLATLPTQFGETAVLRLLDQSQQVLNLSDTGMPPEIEVRFKQALAQPHGMILVTGPTGSGKTTTLYGALKFLNKPELKIVTVEDPIEYRMSRLTQIQVNPKIGLDFASVARASLRHDPDVLLVGEMRDEETVDIGLRSAMTGHLVLSTLHTNDAISSALR